MKRRLLLVPLVLLMLSCGLVNQLVAPSLANLEAIPTIAAVTNAATTALEIETLVPGKTS